VSSLEVTACFASARVANRMRTRCFLGVQRDVKHEAPQSLTGLRVVTAGRLWTTSCDPDLVSDVRFVKIGMPAQLFVKFSK